GRWEGGRVQPAAAQLKPSTFPAHPRTVNRHQDHLPQRVRTFARLPKQSQQAGPEVAVLRLRRQLVIRGEGLQLEFVGHLVRRRQGHTNAVQVRRPAQVQCFYPAPGTVLQWERRDLLQVGTQARPERRRVVAATAQGGDEEGRFPRERLLDEWGEF